MMAEYDYCTTDVIKNARARLCNIRSEVTRLRAEIPTEIAHVAPLLEWIAAHVGALEADLVQHLQAIGGDPLRYDDGRPVVSTIPLDGHGRVIAYSWDPRPDHPTNRPHVAAESVAVGDGTLVDLIVSAPGQLDLRRHKPVGAG